MSLSPPPFPLASDRPFSLSPLPAQWRPGTLAIALGGLALWVVPLLGSPAQAADPAALHRLLSERTCASCELEGAGLVFANLTTANLSNADLSQANLSRAILNDADLRGANLAGAVLYGANLQNADLSGADLRGADLRGAYLGGAKLEGALLQGAVLQGAIAIPPDLISANTYQAWGMNEAQAQRHELAIGYYNQAIQREPKLATAYLGRSFSVSVLGELDQAVRDAEMAKVLFEAEGNQPGLETAEQVLMAIAQARAADAELEANPQELRTGQGSRGPRLGSNWRSSLGSLFRSVGGLVFNMLF